MSRREVRPSTKEASERQKQRGQEEKEILELKKTSTKLRDVIREEATVYVGEELQLVEYTAPTRESAGNLQASEISFDKTTVQNDEYNNEEIEDEFLDPLGAVKTPQKSKAGTSVSREQNSEENWSICNQFFPPNCVLTPYRETRKSNLSSISFNFSPTLNLRSVIEEEEVFDDNLEYLNSEEVTTRNLLSIEYLPSSNRMDEDGYNGKLATVKKEVRKVKRMIDEYSPAAATIADSKVYQNFLADIRKSHAQCQDNLDELLDELDETNETDQTRIAQLKMLSSELSTIFKDNDKQVKEKFVLLMDEYEEHRPMSAAEKASFDTQVQKEKRENDKEVRVAKESKEKAELKIQNAVKKFKDLNQTVLKIKATKLMSEQEIRVNLQESKKWEKKIEEFTSAKEAIDQELVSLAVDDALKTELKEEFEEVIELVTNKIEHLVLKDKDLGLHTLSPNKVKENIVYPDPFHGNVGDNVYKFVKDFRCAIDADQVRKLDQIKTLLKHLKGEARHVVGEHQKDLEEALTALSEAFGSSIQILQKLKENFSKLFGSVREWGKHGSQDRLSAINRTLDFIRQLEALAEDHVELKNQIFSHSTVKVITQGMPMTFTTKLTEICRANDLPEDWIVRISELLESMKLANISAATFGIGLGRNNTFDRESSPESKNNRKSRLNNLKQDNHDCKYSKVCKEEWDLLGCIQLYKIDKVVERKSFLYEKKHCFRCGAKYQQLGHRCSWSKGKFNARCTEISSNSEQCSSGAALCKKHPNNATSELKSWLATNKIKFTVGMIASPCGKTLKLPEASETKLLDDFVEFAKSVDGSREEKLELFNSLKKGITPSLTKPKQISREKLQTGEASQMMSDEEITNLFTNDMRRMKDSSSIQPIPKGEPVFIFCIFQGKKGPIQAFIDSGANCWLALDGVPQDELVSAKMEDGPIPLGVASGMVTYAEAEWASLIPLADGTQQCVRGLTMKRVTGDMPKLNLVPAFEAIKAKCKKSSKIQNLKVPRIVGGEVKMIIGIKYQNIFPVPIHTLPNGLTVFESKLKPTAPGVLACIGGPVEALEHLCGITDTQSTMTYMASLVQNIKDFKPRVDFFPSMGYKQDEIPNDEVFAEPETAFEDGDITFDEHSGTKIVDETVSDENTFDKNSKLKNEDSYSEDKKKLDPSCVKKEDD